MRPLWSATLVGQALPSTTLRSSPFRAAWPRSQHTSSESRLPRLAQSSFWDSMIPKALRNRSARPRKAAHVKPTNPATYFIWIYILIGSQAIRIMGIKSEYMHYSRKADLKIQQLRDVVQKLQRGEEVDVEKILGTGDETQEREWEEAMEELQREDRVWQSNREKTREEKDRLAKEEQDANPTYGAQDGSTATTSLPPASPNVMPQRPGFY